MAFRHCVLGKFWLWLFLLGPAPFAFCFVSLLDGEAHIWLGDLRFALCGLGLLFLLCCDLPTYMTTGVHVDVILTCFFSCKDRASERYRPHQRKKKRLALCDLEAPGWGEPRFPHCAFVASWLTDCCMAFS